MKTLSTFGILLLFSKSAFAQIDCPSGYVSRNVKCSGTISVRCVPENYACNKCWVLEFAPCPGKKVGGAWFYNSYEQALQAAQKESNNWKDGRCSWYDNTKYKIFIDNAKFCSTGLNAGVQLKNDLLNKIKPFLQRFKAEIQNYRRFLAGKPYKPGAVFKEYETLIEQGEQNGNDLELMLNSINDDNLQEIQKAFSDLQKEQQNLQQANINFRSKLNALQQEEFDRERSEKIQQQKENLQVQQRRNQDKVEAQLQLLNRKNKVQADLFSAVLDGLSSILGSLQAEQARKSIAEDERQRDRHFELLKEKIESESGELVNCSSCDGEGYKDCQNCSSTGKSTCGICDGKAGETCTVCKGSGSYQVGSASLSCSACLGKGIKECAFCGNSGKKLCSSCSGLGKIPCSECYGTGQEFKKNYAEKYELEYTPTPRAQMIDIPAPEVITLVETAPIKKTFSFINISPLLSKELNETVLAGTKITSLTLGVNNSFCLLTGGNGYNTTGLKPELLAELKRCHQEKLEINLAANYQNSGWVVVNGRNGYNSKGIPPGAVAELKRCNTENLKISIVAFSPTGGWVIINETNGYSFEGIPLALAERIKECNEKKVIINHIAFAPNGGWVIVSERNACLWNNISAAAIKAINAYNKNGKEINVIAFSKVGYVLY